MSLSLCRLALCIISYLAGFQLAWMGPWYFKALRWEETGSFSLCLQIKTHFYDGRRKSLLHTYSLCNEQTREEYLRIATFIHFVVTEASWGIFQSLFQKAGFPGVLIVWFVWSLVSPLLFALQCLASSPNLKPSSGGLATRLLVCERLSLREAIFQGKRSQWGKGSYLF